MEKNLDITKPHYSEQISPVPWPFLKSSFHCTGISRRKVVKKSARDNPDRYCVWFWPSVPLFFSPLVLYKKSFFFLVGYAILKELSYLFGAKFTCRKFYRWRHDNWPIEQSQHMSIIFFSAWIYKYDSNPFWRNKSTLRLRRSLGRCATSCIEPCFVHFQELMRSWLVASLLLHINGVLLKLSKCDKKRNKTGSF